MVAFLPGVAAADTGWGTLTIDANHRITASAGSFEPSESIAFWFNSPNGGADSFVTDNTGSVTATSDGGLDVTIAASDWARIPGAATSIVAFGRAGGNYAVTTLATAEQQDLSLHIDATHRLTSDKVFSAGERIIFWYNLPDGSAAAFAPDGLDYVVANADGSIDLTLTDAQWATIPTDATSLVAAGIYSQVAIGGVIPR